MVSAAVACLPAAVNLLLLEALFMQISGVSLTVSWPAGFFYSESCVWAAATSFPLSKHSGRGDTAPAFSGLHFYLQFTWEVGLPPSPVEFCSHCHFYKLFYSWLLGVCHHSCLLQLACLFTAHVGSGSFPLSCGVSSHATFTSFPTPGCWVCATAPALLPSPADLWRISPPYLFGTQSALPSLLCIFFCYCLLFSFFFLYSLGWGGSVKGAMLICPSVVCGSTMCRLAHIVVWVFPSSVCTTIWRWGRSPPGFSV
jgi:hypothetical protein